VMRDVFPPTCKTQPVTFHAIGFYLYAQHQYPSGEMAAFSTVGLLLSFGNVRGSHGYASVQCIDPQMSSPTSTVCSSNGS
jgi:hypothetical protein